MKCSDLHLLNSKNQLTCNFNCFPGILKQWSKNEPTTLGRFFSIDEFEWRIGFMNSSNVFTEFEGLIDEDVAVIKFESKQGQNVEFIETYSKPWKVRKCLQTHLLSVGTKRK